MVFSNRKMVLFLLVLMMGCDERVEPRVFTIDAGMYVERTCLMVDSVEFDELSKIVKHSVHELPLAHSCSLLMYKLMGEKKFLKEEIDYIVGMPILLNTYLYFLIDKRTDISMELSDFVKNNNVTQEMVYGEELVGPAEFAWAICNEEAFLAFENAGIVGEVSKGDIKQYSCELFSDDDGLNIMEMNEKSELERIKFNEGFQQRKTRDEQGAEL